MPRPENALGDTTPSSSESREQYVSFTMDIMTMFMFIVVVLLLQIGYFSNKNLQWSAYKLIIQPN